MSRIIPLAALATAGVLAFQGIAGFKTLQRKAEAQAQANEAMERWKQSYLALASTQQLWIKQYPQAKPTDDYVALLDLAQLGRFGLTTNRDAVSLTRIDGVKGNGHDLGLARYCLSSEGATDTGALRVEADSYGQLLKGLRELAAVPFVYVGTIGIQGDKDRPAAILGDFCLQLREGER